MESATATAKAAGTAAAAAAAAATKASLCATGGAEETDSDRGNAALDPSEGEGAGNAAGWGTHAAVILRSDSDVLSLLPVPLLLSVLLVCCECGSSNGFRWSEHEEESRTADRSRDGHIAAVAAFADRVWLLWLSVWHCNSTFDTSRSGAAAFAAGSTVAERWQRTGDVASSASLLPATHSSNSTSP